MMFIGDQNNARLFSSMLDNANCIRKSSLEELLNFAQLLNNKAHQVLGLN